MKKTRKRNALLKRQLSQEEREVQRSLLKLMDLGLDYPELAKLFSVDSNTVRRWSSGENLGRFTQLSRLQLFQEILHLADQAFGKEAEEWFREPNPALGNVFPATLLRDPGNGPYLVRQALYNVLSGAVA